MSIWYLFIGANLCKNYQMQAVAIISVVCLTIAFLVPIFAFILYFSQRRKVITYLTLGLISIYAFIFEFAQIMIYSAEDNFPSALFWHRFQHLGVILFIPGSVHFATSFIQKEKRGLLFCLYLLAFLLLPLSWTNLFLHPPPVKTFFAWQGTPGPLYYVFAVLLIIVVIYSIILILIGFQKSDRLLERRNLLFVLLGSSLFALAGFVDLAATMKFLQFYPLFEYGFFAFIFFCGLSATFSFVNINQQLSRAHQKLQEHTEHLEERINQRTKELSLINQISQAVTSILDLDLLLQEAVHLINRTLGSLYTAIFLLSEDRSELKLRAYVGEEDTRTINPAIKLTQKGLIPWVVMNRAPLIIPDVTQDFRYLKGIEGVISEMVVPLKREEKIIGVIDVGSCRLNAFCLSELRLLEQIAAPLSIAIENAKRYEDLLKKDSLIAKKVEQLSTILSVGNFLKSDLEVKEILKAVCKAAQETSGFQVIAIGLVNENDGTFQLQGFAGVPEEEEKKLASQKTSFEKMRSLLQDKFLISHSYFVSHEYKLWEESKEKGMTYIPPQPEKAGLNGYPWHAEDALLIPLETKEKKMIGLIEVDAPLDGKVPTEETVKTLEILANQAALALENARLFENLKKANQVKSDFVSNVSHELRTPLALIKSYTETVFRHKDLTELQEKSFYEIITSEIDRLSNLIEDLLDLSKLEAGRVELKPTYINFYPLGKKLMAKFEKEAEIKGINLSTDFSKEMSQIFVDSASLEQMLTNLLANAFKFTPPKGKIEMGAKVIGHSGQIWISDTGRGISKEDLPHIFEKFYQAKTTQEEIRGTGLGLSIVKYLVEAQGGKVEVESEWGKGSKFTLYLPLPTKEETIRSLFDNE
ncbi:MAG: ATP-binding protein [Candidatus Edwardsbacteria bacterium]